MIGSGVIGDRLVMKWDGSVVGTDDGFWQGLGLFLIWMYVIDSEIWDGARIIEYGMEMLEVRIGEGLS